MTTRVCRDHFIFALHVELPGANIATPSCDSIGARMLTTWQSLDKKPKVCESVGTYRRGARKIQSG